MEEIYEIAKNAAEEGALKVSCTSNGLSNSTKFSIRSQPIGGWNRRSSPSTRKTFLPQSDDSSTTSRSPLVIVDTNVLVDALVEKMYQRMNLVFKPTRTSSAPIGSTAFYSITLKPSD